MARSEPADHIVSSVLENAPDLDSFIQDSQLSPVGATRATISSGDDIATAEELSDFQSFLTDISTTPIKDTEM